MSGANDELGRANSPKPTETNIERLDVPSYLNTPPRSPVLPPVEWRNQELPFGSLTWEDFERLCFRIARLESDVQHCQRYGTRGQKQEGIDLYARLKGTGEFRVYQCKREENFGSRKIRKAVEAFLGGTWAGRARTLVLCTKESLVETSRAKELERQRDLLFERGIELLVWDSEQLSADLKGLPGVVNDFFGRSWVQVFLGQEVADSLGVRLDASQVSELRHSLGNLYVRLFDAHDPGLRLGLSGTAPSLPLYERYVITDLIEYHQVGVSTLPESQAADRTSGVPNPDSQSEQRDRFDVSERQMELPTAQRVPFESWIGEGKNFLVIGAPGSGKSSLLRFLAIDLLSESPRLDAVAAKWGEFLPVWVSFPLWTRLIATEEQESCSLSKFLHRWLQSLDEERLWPLVEKALQDERLLLLVDGLDEWSELNAAKVGIDRLRMFVERRGIPSVAAGRPHGIERLDVLPPAWKHGHIAPLDRDQQRKLASFWFLFREVNATDPRIANDQALRMAESATAALFEELERSRDLLPLAQNPLLLTLLIYHRFHNTRLPRSRFRAYRSLVDHLIEVHPSRRRVAAQQVDDAGQLEADELRRVLAALAYGMHRKAPEGVFEVKEALRTVETYLQDPEQGFGMERAGSRKLAKTIVNLSEESLGVLAKQSPTEVGFVHRTFQEFLAAHHLATLPPETQQEALAKYSLDPSWREVILALLHSTERTHEVQRIIDDLRGKQKEVRGPEKLYLDSLLSEAAFGDFNCSPRLVRELAREAFEIIETGDRAAHRQELLSHALGGLGSMVARDLVKARLGGWFPCRQRWRSHAFEAFEACPPASDVIECLWLGMHDEDPTNQLAAARALANVGHRDLELGRKVLTLASRAGTPTVRAVALEALSRGWPGLGGLQSVVAWAEACGSPGLQLFALSAKVSKGMREQTDRDRLLALASHWSGLNYSWRKETARLLLDGWSGDPTVKRACIASLNETASEWDIDSGVSWNVLLKGFPQDDDVVDLMVEALDDGHGLTVSRGDIPWHLLVENFKDHRRLVAAADRWFENPPAIRPEAAYTALVGRTAVGKAKLLDILRQDSSPSAMSALIALVRGWGRDDVDVAGAIDSALKLPVSTRSWFAHFYPDLIGDKHECREALLDLLRHDESRWVDRILVGLRKLNDGQPDDEALGLILGEDGRLIRDPGDLFHLMIAEQVISDYAKDPRVRRLALRELSEEEPPYGAILRGFPDDEDLRRAIIGRMTPLPSSLRLQIAAKLADECNDADFVLGILGQYRREEEEHCKVRASIAYWRLACDKGVVTPQMVDQLGRDIVCYGTDHDEQRQAAFCGLVSIDRLDIMATAEETIGQPRLCSIGLASKFNRAHNELARFVAEHWDAVKRSLGDDCYKRLVPSYGSPINFWEQLAPVADGYPSVRDELVAYLESRSDRNASTPVLRFLGRVRPGSSLLQEYCFDALKIGQDELDTASPEAVVASELLGRDFAGDGAVLRRILSGRAAEHPYCKSVLCLCEGWRDHDLLEVAFSDRERAKDYFPGIVWHRLLCVKAASDEVLREWLRVCRTPPADSGRRAWIATPFIRRVQHDDRFVEDLLAKLESEPAPSERVSIPMLLRHARRASDRLRPWAQCEIERQHRLDFPEIGHDIILGVERAVSDALLDVLGSADRFGSVGPP